MALVVMRSAYSPVVRDTMDYSTALCDRNGQLIAQGLTLAVQLGSFPDGMRLLMAEHAAGAVEGDVFLYNDPYGSGGQHLPDFYIVKPIFHDGAIEGWACTMAHHCDVGGIAPGSVAIHAIEIFQEGLCIPIVKLHEAGTAERDTVQDPRQEHTVAGAADRRRAARSSRPARRASAAIASSWRATARLRCAATSRRCRTRPSG